MIARFTKRRNGRSRRLPWLDNPGRLLNPAGYAFQQTSGIARHTPNGCLHWVFPYMDRALAYKQPVEDLGGVVSAMVTYLELGEICAKPG